MPRVQIVTDSACDLPREVAGQLGVEVVPLTIRFGDQEYTDGANLSADEFYALMASSDALPETAAPSPGAFEEAFRKASGGGDSVVCINLSSKLSATMASAQNAARALQGDVDVRVVDSRSITAGLGAQVEAASRAASEGATAEEIVAMIEDLRERTHVFGALDTLDNLRKGGRIGGAQAMLGTMLSIKPIIDISTGEVTEAAKQRTRRKAMTWLRDKVFEQPPLEHLWVCSGGAADLDDFLGLLAPRYAKDKITVSTIGPVIGTHGGPRVLGVVFHDPPSSSG